MWMKHVLDGAAASAESTNAAGEYYAEAHARKQNAINLENQASQVGSVAARNEEQARREYRQLAGDQAAAQAENGFDAGGSALDVVRDSETQAYLDALNIRYAGESEARSLRFSASQERLKSKLASKMVSRVKWATHLAAAGASMGGGGGGGGGAYGKGGGGGSGGGGGGGGNG